LESEHGLPITDDSIETLINVDAVQSKFESQQT